MKILIVLLAIFSLNTFAQEYTHSELQEYVGYKNLNEHPSINRKQLEFLSFYTDRRGPWFEEVNDYLRTGIWYGWGTDDLVDYVSEIDGLMTKTPPLPEDAILYRGQSMEWLGRHYSIGEEFEDKAFYSTTSKMGVGRFYAGYSELSFIMVLYFGGEDNTNRGLVLNNIDQEVLLKRGLRFKVMESVKGTIRRYGLVQICSESGCDNKIKNKKIKRWWNDFKEEKLGVNSYYDVSGGGVIASKLTQEDALPDA